MKTERKAKRRAGIAIMVLVLLVLMALIAFLFVQGKLSRIHRVSEVTDVVAPEEQTFEVDEDSGPDTIAPEAVEWNDPLVPEAMEGVKTILLIGQDARLGEGRQRSDSMILCSLNSNTKTITMCSLMRDLYVPIPGYADNRINAAYAFGGMPLLDATIEQAFGVHVDGNIEVDLNGFLQAMQTVGPLEISLTDEEAAYLNTHAAFGSDNDTATESWHLTGGVNVLTPSQALAYARTRGVGNADYERTDRQRRVLQAAFTKLASSDLTTLLSISDEILPALTTDMTNLEILDLVRRIKLSNMQLASQSYRVPADGLFSPESIRGMSVLVPDLAANSQYLQQVLYEEAA